MYPKKISRLFISKLSVSKSLSSKQSGLGLPVAIFIITIMSIIALAVNRLNEASSQTYSQNLLSTRSFYAAESGAQLRAQTVLPVLTVDPCSCGSDVTYDFTVAGLNSCSAITICDEFTANGATFCTITSIGSCDNTNAQRTIEVRVK
jgi:MSHA biogenesis protein MshP